jgi:hypothetical protein
MLTTVSHGDAHGVKKQILPRQKPAARASHRRLDPNIIEIVRAASPVLEIVGEHVPRLRRSGKLHVSHCPWHHGRSGRSFTVDAERGMWRCWSCNIGGDVFRFVMELDGCNFIQAVARLAQRAGIVISLPVPQRIAERMQLRRELAQVEEQIAAAVRTEFLRVAFYLDATRSLRRNAAKRLDELHAGACPRFAGEAEACWAALAIAYEDLRELDTAFCILGFAQQNLREHFAAIPEARGTIIEEALADGYISDEHGVRHLLGVAA